MKAKTFNDLKTFTTLTLGCKVNLYETNVIANDLLSFGLINVDDFKSADLIIINTCSVTNKADSKSKNVISRANRENPNAIILVCGCYSQVASNNLKGKYGIDILLGNKYKNNIVDILKSFFKEKKQLVKIENLLLEKEFEASKTEIYCDRTRAFVKIQDGCNFMCSYCIIPFTRGRQRSKNFFMLLQEIQTLVKNGYQEIVLTGVNTAGYSNNEHNFFDLLREINNMKGNFRVRISSVEPFQITNEIITLVCTNPHRFAQHWHICLQSGSDHVLKDMNRKYTTKQFTELIQKIYKYYPLSSITTDYICGFPTETDTDHEISINFIKKIGFSKLHVFPYSKRSYTPAAKLVGVTDTVKKQRVNDMLQLSHSLSKQYLQKFINKIVTVLFETYDVGINSGYCGEYFIVKVNSTDNLVNKLCQVKIQKIIFDYAIGEIIN